MWRSIDLRRRARPNARLSAAGGETRDGPVRDGRGKAEFKGKDMRLCPFMGADAKCDACADR